MLTLFGLVCCTAPAAEPRPPKLFLIGGSTLGTFPDAQRVVGWGQMLPRFFKDPAQVDNRGKKRSEQQELHQPGTLG